MHKNLKKIILKVITLLLTTAMMLSGCGTSSDVSGNGMAGNQAMADDADSTDASGETSGLMKGFENLKNGRVDDAERKAAEAIQILTPAWTNTGKYQSAWDLTELYADEAAFMSDYNKLMGWAKSLADYEGTLTDKDSIYEYLKDAYNEEMNEIFDKLEAYASLGMSLDVSDNYYYDLNSKLDVLNEEYSHSVSFAAPEIMSIPYEERIEIFADDCFDDMRYLLSYYTSDASKDYSKEIRDKIAEISTYEDDGQEAYIKYQTTEYTPLDFEYTLGKSVPLTYANYSAIMQGPVDRELKIAAYNKYMEGYISRGDVYAGFLQDTISTKWKIASLYDYKTTMEYALAGDGLNKAVYDGVIKAARDSVKEYQRYLELHKRAMSLDEQYLFDVPHNPSGYDASAISFDDAIDITRQAVAVLGKDYADYYDQIVNGTNLDAVRGENRESGYYTLNGGKKTKPHIFANYSGTYASVSALSHELGHAVNYCYTNSNQPSWYSDVAIYDSEVCSIMHELLLNAYMVENASDDEEKLYYLSELLEIYSNSFFIQCMYSEFEDYLYKEVEAGRTLDTDKMNAKLLELSKKYRGDAVNEMGAECWMSVDHLHYCYYMYKYATSICYASSLADKILRGDSMAIAKYKEFMSAGSSTNSMNVLEIAGIDPESAATYKDASAYYSSLVDEYEKLLKSCGKIE